MAVELAVPVVLDGNSAFTKTTWTVIARFTIHTELPKLVIAHVALLSNTGTLGYPRRRRNAQICLQREPRSAGRPAKSHYNATLVFSKRKQLG